MGAKLFPIILQVILCYSVAAVPSAVSGAIPEDNVRFLVRGKITWTQSGNISRSEEYSFTARCEPDAWSISAIPHPKGIFDEILAVGNEKGVFIALDTSTTTRAANPGAIDVVPNTSMGIASADPVPNSSFAAPLGPIWLTFLSASYFKNADPTRVSPPISFNVAGGSTIPPAIDYYQPAQWTTHPSSGLPSSLVSQDQDGFQKGILSGSLVRIKKYPPPFDRGFTNVTFQVIAYDVFQGLSLPRHAELEVFWIRNGKRERVHKFLIEAHDFEPPGPAPLPEPTSKGVVAVSDWRLKTKQGPILLQYVATNRFLTPGELTNLPSFKEAVQDSLGRTPPRILSTTLNRRGHVFAAALVAISFFFAAALFFSRRTSRL